MNAKEQRCIECGSTYRLDEVHYGCRCGSPLEVTYDYGEIEKRVERHLFDSKNISLWKYGELLPAEKKVSLNEGGTSLLKCTTLEEHCEFEIYLKNEGENPTGSFEDRGMTVGVSKALDLGFKGVACVSVGNASASLAAYAAKAGIQSHVTAPSGTALLGKLAQTMVHGAKLIPIDGNFDDAAEMVLKFCGSHNLYLLTSANPFVLEGQKTVAFEIFDQLGFVPDKIILPAGNGSNMSAIWKGFKELDMIGVIDKLPEIVGIQAEGSSMVKSFCDFRAELASEESHADWKNAMRVARESKGRMESVGDKEILESQRFYAYEEGIFLEKDSALAMAGLKRLSEEIGRNEKVVVLTTRHGLKMFSVPT